MNTLQLEKHFTFKSFQHHQALEFGMNVLEIIKEEKLKNVRIRVTYNKDIVFQYLMDDKNGEEWLNRKENTVLKTNHSSYYVFENSKDYQELENDDKYVICGGGFPLIENSEVKGVFCISGLEHDKDHELIIKALRKMREFK
ncbi:MAG: heme-binding protein [Thomasclavelia sp.]|nr:heme-binding protein [Thomasclavelia sp.]